MPIIPEDEGEFRPGVYLAEVRACDERCSKAGNEMFVVTWKAVGFPPDMGDLCTDFITFSRKAAGITGAKLGVWGFDPGDNVTPRDLLGKRAYLLIWLEEYEGRKSPKVRVDFDNGCRAGYWAEDLLPDHIQPVKPPTGKEPQAAEEDDTPF